MLSILCSAAAVMSVVALTIETKTVMHTMTRIINVHIHVRVYTHLHTNNRYRATKVVTGSQTTCGCVSLGLRIRDY